MNAIFFIDEQDPLADCLAISMRAAKTGWIKFDIDGQSAARIDIIDHKNTTIIDLLQPSLFKTPEDGTCLFDN